VKKDNSSVRKNSSGMTATASLGQTLPLDQEPGAPTLLWRGTDGGEIRRTILPGGLRVITESVPTVRSAAFGIWVGLGSRDETPSLAGATHYLEHLLFKGTKRRAALDISAALDAVGGEMNAFTTKEYTCYYARVLDSDLPLAIDVICDVVTSSLIRAEDVDSERDVILEEIAMHEDDPTDTVHETLAQTLLGDHSLGRPVLGTVASIKGLNQAEIAQYYQSHYCPPSMVVTAAGNVDHAQVVKLVEAAFQTAHMLGKSAVAPAPPRIGSYPLHADGQVAIVNRPTEQANLVLGLPGMPRTDDRRFALGVLNSVLGGGASSRLFQEVREKRGLAYAVGSFATSYADLGVVGIYAGCLPHKAHDVLQLCRAQLRNVAEKGITAEELTRGIGQQRGSLVLGLEDTGSRMSRLGKSELVYGDLPSVDELLDRIAAVTQDEVAEVAHEVFGAAPTLAVVGPFDDNHDFAAALR